MKIRVVGAVIHLVLGSALATMVQQPLPGHEIGPQIFIEEGVRGGADEVVSLEGDVRKRPRQHRVTSSSFSSSSLFSWTVARNKDQSGKSAIDAPSEGEARMKARKKAKSAKRRGKSAKAPRLPRLRTVANYREVPLEECQGHCVSDDDCFGEMICYRRGHSESVPGCSGNGVDGDDYCCFRPANYLRYFDTSSSLGEAVLGLCEGDCDTDIDCDTNSGLRCEHRNGYTPVTGCDGEGRRGADYCVLGGTKGPSTDKELVTLNDPTFPLEKCRGLCNDDGDCFGEMVCYRRGGSESVPGCLGDGVDGDDYCCFRPANYLRYIGSSSLEEGVLGLCEGDCDTDIDCDTNSGLRCEHRNLFGPVTGCDGEGRRGADYCVLDGTRAPVTGSTTNVPTKTPVTEGPTTSPNTSSPTKSPTRSPVTNSPTKSPVTGSPTRSPVTDTPSKSPIKDAPTPNPVTEGPTTSPATDSTTSSPSTNSPTKTPFTGSPTRSPATDAPTKSPITDAPTQNPVTEGPTPSPATDSPTPSPNTSSPTQSPTRSPVTNSPTKSPDTGEGTTATYVPGDLTVSCEGLTLSTGMACRLLTQKGQRVQFADGTQSSARVHGKADGAGVIPHPSDGGWYYASNSEVNNDNGGVGVLRFNANGDVIGYERTLTGTSRNCGGGVTYWDTWVSCEEDAPTGRCYEVDPFTGHTSVTKVTSRGGDFESFAYDNQDPISTRFFVTEDDDRGALVRYTPHQDAFTTGNNYDILTSDGGVHEYLVLDDASMSYTWSSNIADGEDSAALFFPGAEGIDVHNRVLNFVSKTKKELITLDLAAQTWTKSTTLVGLFNMQPDQLGRILGDSEALYFCEDGGVDSDIHMRNSEGEYKTIVQYEGNDNGDEATGLAFSPDGMFMYVAWQNDSLIYAFWRTDGLPFNAEVVSTKYH